MFIVLDTNVWLQQLGMNSALGAATRFYLRQKSARVALPEVVRLEAETHFRSSVKEFIQNIGENHRKLLTIFGSLKEIVLPDDAQVEAKISQIFDGLGVELLNIPFSIESARDSFLKTIVKEPPSDQNQQFKDGVLWADCRKLLEIEDVYLVTADKAFYSGRRYEAGLAGNLKAEVSGAIHSFRLFASLEELLTDIKTKIVIDDDKLLVAYLDQERQRLNHTLTNNGFAMGATAEVQSELYITENPAVLYLQFSAVITCEDVSGEGRGDARFVLQGRGQYNVESGSFDQLQSRGESLSFRTAEGEQVVRNIVVGVASIVLGQRTIVHTIRHKVD
jgi:hypothetical protein